jgi:hypothetical protein
MTDFYEIYIFMATNHLEIRADLNSDTSYELQLEKTRNVITGFSFYRFDPITISY